jgi:hypothetical protein
MSSTQFNKEKIQEILSLANQMIINNLDIRWGQAVFNSLHQLYPEIANKIRSTEYDPFYIDEKVNNLIKYLEEYEV